MLISKTTTKKFNVLQARANMFTFNEDYRRIRGNMRYKGFKCFNCNKQFEEGEKFGLIITDKGNKTICNSCVENFIR